MYAVESFDTVSTGTKRFADPIKSASDSFFSAFFWGGVEDCCAIANPIQVKAMIYK